MRRTWTKFLLAVSLCGLSFFIIGGDLAWTPVLDLEEMQQVEGVLVKVGYGRRHATLRVRLESGEIETYYGDFRGASDKVEACLNKKVTFWTQRIYEGWPPFISDVIKEIQLNGETILGYVATNQKQYREEYISIFRFILCTSIILILIVGAVCSNQREQSKSNQRGQHRN